MRRLCSEGAVRACLGTCMKEQKTMQKVMKEKVCMVKETWGCLARCSREKRGHAATWASSRNQGHVRGHGCVQELATVGVLGEAGLLKRYRAREKTTSYLCAWGWPCM